MFAFGSFATKAFSEPATSVTTVTPGTGHLAFTGHAPGIALGIRVIPDKGAFVFAGAAPAVTRTANQFVAPVKGSLVFLGYAPAIAQATPSVVQPAVGHLVFSGYAPAIAQIPPGVVQPTTGHLVFSGYAPAISIPSLPTIGRPSADLSAGGWVPSTGTDLYPMVDEVTPADGDYISTSTASTCEMELNETAYPGTTTQVFRVRASSTSGSSLVIALKQGATVIATRTQVLTPTLTTYSYALTSGEIALIGAGALSISLQAV